MRIEFFGFLAVLGLAILAGCQTLSKEECVAADWRVIGEQDGAAGHAPQERFGDHAKSCERAGVVPNQSLWNEGYQIGLRRFCTPLGGLAHGQKGKSYANMCPPELSAGFNTGYSVGLKYHHKQKEIDTIKSQIRSYEYDTTTTRELIKKGKIDQTDGEVTIRTNQRVVNDLNRELGRKEAELSRINDEVENFRLDQQFGGSSSSLYN